MKAKSKLLALLLASTMVLGSFAGCGEKTDAPSAENDTKTEEVKKEDKKDKGGEKVFKQTNDICTTLNPFQASSAPENAIFAMIHSPLVRNTAVQTGENATQIVPAAAESWDVSEDGLTYTFHIRDTAWSDGDPLTANDFEWNFKMMADPDVGSVKAWLFDGVIENFGESLYSNGKTPEDIGVKAIDEKTLEIKLVHPASYFTELLSSMYPVKRDVYEELGEKYGSSLENTPCSGPFMLDTWNQNTELNVVKNPNYWNYDNIPLDRIENRVIQENTTAVQAFISGELDTISTSDTNWQKVIDESGVADSKTVPGNAPEFLMFNMNNEFLSNTKVRQALSIAFDRQQFVDDIFDGVPLPIYSTMPDTMMVGDTPYHELVNDKNYFVKELQAENPDPKALLIEGLKELGKGEDPSVMTVRYASRGTSEKSKKMAEWYKQTWETTLGINVQIDMMEWNIMWDKIDAGDYDIAVAGWGPYYNEPSAILTLFDPENGYFNAQKTGWVGEDADKFHELYIKATTIPDPVELAQVYLQAEELLVKNAVIAPEYLSSSPTYVAKHVKNLPITTTGQWDYELIDIEK